MRRLLVNSGHKPRVGLVDSCAVKPGQPRPPFFVSAHSKGLSILRKSFKMSTCGDFLEVFILKGLRD